MAVTANALDANGQGIAHAEGKTIFVKGLLPQETARIRLTEEKRQFAKGEVITRLTTNPERVTPPCQYYQHCGGCQQQQHVLLIGNAPPKAEVFITSY